MHEEKNASAEIGKIKVVRVLVTTTLLLLRFLNLRSVLKVYMVSYVRLMIQDFPVEISGMS